MDDVLDVFEFDLGELVEGGLQLVLAAVLLLVGLLLMVLELVLDGVFLWGLLLFIGGVVVAVLGALSLLDSVF
jgi:hypothetical protein